MYKISLAINLFIFALNEEEKRVQKDKKQIAG